MSIDLIFIILIIVLAIAILLAVSSLRNWLFPAAIVIIGSAESDPVCNATNEHIDTFLNGRFTSELAGKMEELVSDIAFDVEDLNEKKIKTMKESSLNTAAAKLLLDSMLHYYIYDKSPNNISHAAIVDNIKKLEIVAQESLCFTKNKITQVIDYLKQVVKLGKDKETKTVPYSARECFRKVQILQYANDASERKKLADEIDRLKDEISKKNVELRQKSDELDREKNRSRGNSIGISSLSSELLLDECNRERRLLQEKVYELRRDIERIRASSSSDTEMKALRDRVEELRTRNAQLENQLRESERGHGDEMNEIIKLTTELNNCRKLLDEVLNA